MTVRVTSESAWLLLTFTLPTKRASQRVEIWRKLQRYGTVPLGNSGYLLPNNSSNEERFQWLSEQIRAAGGEATLIRVAQIEGVPNHQLMRMFNEARAAEYQELSKAIRRGGFTSRSNSKGWLIYELWIIEFELLLVWCIVYTW